MTKSIYSERLEVLCTLLAEARMEAGLTQRQLAKSSTALIHMSQKLKLANDD